jgi:uncharacterized protein (DUF2141 family)
MPRLGALAALPLLLAGNSAATVEHGGAHDPRMTSTVLVSFTGLRSDKGMLRACLTQNPAFFPRCEKDPDALKASTPAQSGAHLRFIVAGAGDYAITALHDENANARADMWLGIPREGVGFSENPAITFGPPKFKAARFTVAGGDVTQTVRMRYFF